MRPIRAVAFVAVGLAFYGGMRATAVRDDVARRFDPLITEVPPASAPLLAPIAPTPPGFPGEPPPAAPPEVMVYSSPAPGADGRLLAPRPLWRLRARRLEPRQASEREVEVEAGLSPSVVRRVGARPAMHTPLQATETAPDMAAAAYDAATRAYAYLQAGDRRAAASAFAVALSLDPSHPRASAWAKEKDRLGRWWRVEAYVFQRAGDGTLIRTPGLPAATNVLGGGSASTMLALTPNPLGRHPVELQMRYSQPMNGFSRADTGRAQAAVGIAVQPLRRVPVTLVAERLFKIGSLSRSDWQARMYGGTSRRVRGIDVSAFGEAGIVGRRPDRFAGAQLIAERAFKLPAQLDMGLGVGAWSSVQTTDRTTSRVDVGPTLRISHPKLPVTFRIEYRAHLAGNARPGSGVALTVSSLY